MFDHFLASLLYLHLPSLKLINDYYDTLIYMVITIVVLTNNLARISLYIIHCLKCYYKLALYLKDAVFLNPLKEI